MLDLIKAIIYGIVEGITEWLPISSTGHLILLKQMLPFQETGSGFFDMFDVVIQFGAILAVVVLFWNKIWPFTFLCKKQTDAVEERGFLKKDIWDMWIKILISCVPAAVIGLLFDDLFTSLFYNPVCVALALILFGVAFIVVERRQKGVRAKINTVAQIDARTAALIGLFQVIAAIFPGTSRSGATIIGALLIGVSREAAAEYTFFLAIPVMFGASLLKILKFGLSFTALEGMVLILGAFTAFIVSLFVVRFIMNYVKKHDFQIFGIYRIILGIIVLLCWR